jgi:hypothetical protein
MTKVFKENHVYLTKGHYKGFYAVKGQPLVARHKRLKNYFFVS